MAAAQSRRRGRYPHHDGSLPITCSALPTCRAQYPGGPQRGHLSVTSPLHAAFPDPVAGRHPQIHFRGLLRLHARYGPLDCSAAQGDLCHKAPIRPVAQPNRLSATRATDFSPDGIFLHWCYTPSGRTLDCPVTETPLQEQRGLRPGNDKNDSTISGNALIPPRQLSRIIRRCASKARDRVANRAGQTGTTTDPAKIAPATDREQALPIHGRR